MEYKQNENEERVQETPVMVVESGIVQKVSKANKHKFVTIIVAVCAVALLAAVGFFAIREIKVRKVESLIDDIGTVTINSGKAIDEARDNYDALSSDLQGKVGNRSVLSDAEKKYDLLKTYEANRIKNYSSFDSTFASKIDNSVEEWMENDLVEGLLFLFLVLDAGVDTSDVDMNAQYICVCKEDERIDIYGCFKNGEVMGIQYWPKKKSGQVGSVATHLSIKEYVKMLNNCEVIDEYSALSASAVKEAATLLLDAIS